jgi:MFS family permease
MADSQSVTGTPKQGWMSYIGPYQWIVLATCYAGGMFDGLDSTLFTAVLPVAVGEMLGTSDPTIISAKGSLIAAMFLIGWTVGGMLFGTLGDHIGRVKALSISILIYALFTGLCGFAQNWEQLAFFRFMTALGIGGELIVGTTLLAESWPEKYRTRAVGFLTTAYQGGVCLVGLTNMVVGQFSWRYLFFVGALPALIVMIIRKRVKEPERWAELNEKRQSGELKGDAHASNFFHLFRKAHLKNVLIASTFTGALLIAYWASSFWIPAWVKQLLPGQKAVTEISCLLLLQGGFAMLGSSWAGFLVEQIGRRWTLVLANAGYLLTSLGMFGLNHGFSSALYYWGAAMGVFIGMTISVCYIYVPELFPTRLRGTGTGFCFNLGRIAAALGVVYSSSLVKLFGGSYAHAAMNISYILLLAIVMAAFAPETKGKPLPE